MVAVARVLVLYMRSCSLFPQQLYEVGTVIFSGQENRYANIEGLSLRSYGFKLVELVFESLGSGSRACVIQLLVQQCGRESLLGGVGQTVSGVSASVEAGSRLLCKVSARTPYRLPGIVK